MDSRRRIGLTTSLGQKNANMGSVLDYRAATSGGVANWRIPVDLRRRIGLTTPMDNVLIAVWGYLSLG
jgi:hypothetical protein